MSNPYRTPKDQLPAVPLTDKTIVIDLDQTLLATQDKMDSLTELGILSNPHLVFLRNRTYFFTVDNNEDYGAGRQYGFWGVTRPHVEEFLLFCFSYFRTVVIWSAGHRSYVEVLVDYLFRDLPRPHYIFTHYDIEYDEDGNVLKPLSKLINHDDQSRKLISLHNTLALDDNSSTFSLNPDSGVLIPAYEPELSIISLAKDDHALLQFKNWLLRPEIQGSSEVGEVEKDHIFSVVKS
jgi:hypothetical protein